MLEAGVTFHRSVAIAPVPRRAWLVAVGHDLAAGSVTVVSSAAQPDDVRARTAAEPQDGRLTLHAPASWQLLRVGDRTTSPPTRRPSRDEPMRRQP